MRSQRPFQFDVLRSLSCLAHSKHLPPSHPALFLSICLLFSLSRLFATRLSTAGAVCLSFSFLRVPFAKLRSIFHLELRRSLAINPRIYYGLRGPYCSFLATSARCLPADLPTFLPACLLAPVIGFASLRGTTSTIQTRRLSGMRRHSRSLVRRGFSRVPP